MNRIPSLDGLRAFSILLVIVGHLSGESAAAAIAAGLGVHIFFVISGYLITTLLQQEHAKRGSISLRAFYRRRCFRIFPAAYAYMLIIAVVSPASRSGLLYAVTYTTSWNLYKVPLLFWHMWSLSIEEQFYLLWPLALVLGYRYRTRIAWGTVAAAAIFRLMLALYAPPDAFPYLHYSFPGSMDSLAAGCLLAAYQERLRPKLAWMVGPTAIVIAIPLTAWTLYAACWGAPTFRANSAFFGVVSMLIALWIFLLIERRDWVFNNRLAGTIGVLSYSLYLWQQPFVFGSAHVALALLGLSGCAVASYLLVERPMLKLGAALGRKGSRHQDLLAHAQSASLGLSETTPTLNR